MRKAVIFGSGGHSRVVFSILNSLKTHQVINIVDLVVGYNDEKILGVPVVDVSYALERLGKESNLDIFLAIGDNKLRFEWWERLKNLGFTLPNLVSPYAIVDDYSKIGQSNIICANACIGPESNLGDNNLINTGATLEHEVVVGSHTHIGPQSIVAGRCQVGSNCFIGAGVVIVNNAIVPNGTTLGAGAVLVESVDEVNATYVGVPARKVKS
jgi:UDP-perosamine 4-acetyltransferase